MRSPEHPVRIASAGEIARSNLRQAEGYPAATDQDRRQKATNIRQIKSYLKRKGAL